MHFSREPQHHVGRRKWKGSVSECFGWPASGQMQAEELPVLGHRPPLVCEAAEMLPTAVHPSLHSWPSPGTGKSSALAILHLVELTSTLHPGHLLSLLKQEGSWAKITCKTRFSPEVPTRCHLLKTPKCKATKWCSVSLGPSCATLGPEELRSHLLS